MIRGSSPLAVLVATTGFIVWAVGFSALYGLSALACEYGWIATQVAGVSAGRALLIVVWGAHIALLAWLVGWGWQRHPSDETGAAKQLSFLTKAIAAAGLVAMIWTGAPIVTTSACLPPQSPSVHDRRAS